MKFKINIRKKTLVFDTDVKGLIVGDRVFVSEREGQLIYDQIKGLKAESVTLQMSSNTSTLIPALKILGLHYNDYFDQKDVVASQNDISFYWNKSKLAAYYNRYSTDDLAYDKRETVIRKAVNFIINSIEDLPLRDEYLDKISEPVVLLGFYQGFPVFDDNTGFAKLKSRLGIHVGKETVTISTPLDRYGPDVYELGESIFSILGQKPSKKKNRVIFKRTAKLLSLLKVS